MVRGTGALTGLVARLLRYLRQPVPAPPERFRRGPLRADAFTGTPREPRLTARLGIALGIAVGICFLTGYLSHAIQQPPWWFSWPSRPVNLYRVTQGLHVATGLAAIPLLLGKLWSAYPRLFAWPPVRDRAHALERAGVAVLVAGSVLLLATGVLNIARWYAALPFFFTVTHYWTAWLVVGALAVHIGVKLPVIREALRRQEPSPADRARRRVLATIVTAAGVVTVATVGQTFPPLGRVSPLAPRRPGTGPQGLPVNKSAAAAGVVASARDPSYRLAVTGPRARLDLSLADLTGLAQHTVRLPITCVEGWSAAATWTGVRIRDLLDAVGAAPDAWLRVESMQPAGRYRASTLPPAHARDPLTLLALRVNGEPLHLDHGYPCRLVAPNRPGVLQTKWVARLTVLAERP